MNPTPHDTGWADALPADVADRIAAMWRTRGDAYQPRTRHLDENGRPRYTNRLFLEHSPYLLQHAHNPVAWYPWGDAAFETARRLDRPVLLSVGYSTCHWCHVMEAESFEDEEIAAVINANYVPVKVDREQRPDVDAVYMSAVQALAGRGGWPMTVWLTPDREPFYGGTYFPARDGDRGQPVGFLTLLRKIRASYDEQRDVVNRAADELTRAVRRMLAPPAGDRLPSADVLQRAVDAAATRFDRRYGGIAGAPKFPSGLPLRLLLRHYRRTGDRSSLEMAALTLTQMADGGMNDQVGGGFHRYSTDERWRVPHFEKMLYDNALLVPAYLDGWQATGKLRFRQVVRATLDYVVREMTAPEGTFYAATDADSPTPDGRRDEGYYFTWTPAEIDAALSPVDARLAKQIYGVTPGGNFEGRSVLHRAVDMETAAAGLNLTPADLSARLEHIDRRLYEIRAQRPAPLRDDKVLTAWNGLMISAFARAGVALGDRDALNRARRAADTILAQALRAGRLARCAGEGIGSGEGFLEDYAFLTAALLDLFAATGDRRWLDAGIRLDEVLADRFEDADGGGFYMTASDRESLIAREKPCFDGALPSGNAVAIHNLIRLAALTAEARYRERAQRGLSAFSAIMEASPMGFGDMLTTLDDFLHPPPQVVVIRANGDDDDELADLLRARYLPGSTILNLTGPQAAGLADRLPVVAGKTLLNGRATAYVCRQGACGLPVNDAAGLAKQLEERKI